MTIDFENFSRLDLVLKKYLFPFLMKVIAAFVLWFLVELLIRTLKRFLTRALTRKHVDPTLIVYSKKTLGFGLKILAAIFILEIFGIETTSFSAILAAAGVAIGVAWSGLLSNFAAGIFLILFRPFKLGDSISAGGVSGVVREIGLFATIIDSGDNLRYFVGNNKLFTDNILNYSSNSFRIAQFRIQLAHSVEPVMAIELFVESLKSVCSTNLGPAPSGEILEFNPMGTVILLKIPCPQSEYAQVINEGNRRVADLMRKEAFPIPEFRISPLLSASRSET